MTIQILRYGAHFAQQGLTTHAIWQSIRVFIQAPQYLEQPFLGIGIVRILGCETDKDFARSCQGCDAAAR